MLLVIDIGNTSMGLGVFNDQELKHSWRVATRKHQSADEYAVLYRNLFQLEGLSLQQVQGIVICSVVPPLNEVFTQLSTRYFSVKPLFVEPETQNLMPVRYHPPSDVGADRIASAVATFEMVGGPAIVVDFGTATTFDAISRTGEYLGGIIAPGIGISADALFSRASRLPRIDLKKPEQLIGESTVSSMQSGIYYGYVGLVEGILARMKAELGAAQVVATGGLASLVASDARTIDRVEENLILYGLRLFYNDLSAKA
ncbi:MAG: type III pantothenate kinase [Acidobacteriota bacterium]